MDRIEGGLDNINAEMKVRLNLLSSLALSKMLTSGGGKTFDGYGEVVWAVCDALVQEEKDQGGLSQFGRGW